MKQSVSELIDSELDERAARHVIAAIGSDPSLEQAWNDYHLIGDALRSNSRVSIDVRAAVASRVAQEPTVLAPRRWIRRPQARSAGAAVLAASVSFAAVIAWQQLSGPGRVTMVAAQSSPAATQQFANADAYFLAHQEMTADQGLVKVTYAGAGSRGAGTRRAGN